MFDRIVLPVAALPLIRIPLSALPVIVFWTAFTVSGVASQPIIRFEPRTRIPSPTWAVLSPLSRIVLAVSVVPV